ncbi:unnamed protein product [Periconia digitata]|uniref:Riboflavin kinase n=1 Tax=Periconia digitata TaxID=1303443 RepID=A0A9W4XT78_9PLEO|nr:unnamed protein product [Periconia digitata]
MSSARAEGSRGTVAVLARWVASKQLEHQVAPSLIINLYLLHICTTYSQTPHITHHTLNLATLSHEPKQKTYEPFLPNNLLSPHTDSRRRPSSQLTPPKHTPREPPPPTSRKPPPPKPPPKENENKRETQKKKEKKRTMSQRPSTRPPLAGPSTVLPPYPLKLRGPVIKGFGRGSKELGIPTANIPLSGLSVGGNSDLESGIYYGYAALDHSSIPALTSNDAVPSATDDTSVPVDGSRNFAVKDLEEEQQGGEEEGKGRTVYPTVLSIGYNPYYKNTQRSIEIHLLHSFERDFYGATLSLVILGYVRPEYDYVSKEALVEDIREDIRVAQRSLEREAYKGFAGDEWLVGEA